MAPLNASLATTGRAGPCAAVDAGKTRLHGGLSAGGRDTLHWHGLEVPGEVDGGHRVIAPGATRTVSYANAAGGDLLVFIRINGSTGRQVGDGRRPGADRG